MGDIAFAAGFATIRTFNDTVLEVFALVADRTAAAGSTGLGRATARPVVLSLRLPFRAPMWPDNLFGHLVATAVPGVEEWRGRELPADAAAAARAGSRVPAAVP